VTRFPAAAAIGLIVNRGARGVRRRYLDREPFWQRQVPEELVHVTGTLEELEAAVAAMRDAGVRAVAILGGDGTVHRVVTALLRRYGDATPPLLLALAGGTMNGIARALGTGGAPESALQAAVESIAIAMPPVRVRRPLRVSDAREACIRYGFGFATGLIYRAYQHYYRAREPGMIDVMRACLLPVTSALSRGSFYDRLHLEVCADGASWLPGRVHTVLASVLDQPLLWFTPFGSSASDTVAFHLGVNGMEPRELAPRLWSIFRGHCRHPALRIGRVEDATVCGNIGYLIDGDLYAGAGGLDVRLTLGPPLGFFGTRSSRRVRG
jgi:hypothetical protein